MEKDKFQRIYTCKTVKTVNEHFELIKNVKITSYDESSMLGTPAAGVWLGCVNVNIHTKQKSKPITGFARKI